MTHDDDPQWKAAADVERDKARYHDRRVVLLVRDPRDVIVSLYHQMHGGRRRQDVAPVDASSTVPSGGFASLLAFYDAWAAALDVPAAVLVVRYEDLHADPAGELTRVLAFAGAADVPYAVVADAVEQGAFATMRRFEEAGRRSDSSGPSGPATSAPTRPGGAWSAGSATSSGRRRSPASTSGWPRHRAPPGSATGRGRRDGPTGGDMTPPAEPPLPFVFVVGCGRSGTTVLRTVLDAHPALAVAHEARFVAPLGLRRARYERPDGFAADRLMADLAADRAVRTNLEFAEADLRDALAARQPVADFPDAVRRVFALWAGRRGKARYGDKFPGYVLRMPLLAGLFPEARFVHIVRDGRDVALSSMAVADGGDAESDPVALALDWVARVTAGRDAGADARAGRYHEVRYEALVGEPEPVIAGSAASSTSTTTP